MITEAQRKYVTRSFAMLEAMWEQRRRWWFCHSSGDLVGEAKAAVRAAKLRAELIERTGLPDVLVRGWEREWDDWFEKKTKNWLGASR